MKFKYSSGFAVGRFSLSPVDAHCLFLSVFEQSLTEPSTSQANTTTTINGESLPERPAHLPARPQTGRPPLKRPDMTKPPHASIGTTPSNPRPGPQTRDPGSITPSKRSLSSGEAPHLKRAKSGLTEERQPTPSLLSRMTKSVAGDTEWRHGAAGKKRDSSEVDKHPMGGYSIKGAASHAERGEEFGNPAPGSSSLLDRLNRSEDVDGGNRRRNRGKA